MDAGIPRTLIDAVRFFKDADNCREFMATIRWPDGVKCPTCGSEKVGFLANQGRWQCSSKHPKRQFSVKVGTIFEDSPIGLDRWLPAVWLLVNCKNGISSYEVARDLAVTQKTAWFMLHRIRKAMQTGTFEKVSGQVEADETFIGGLARFMHKADRARKIGGTGGAGKAIVMGILDRNSGKVRVKHVPNTQRRTLQGEIRQHVEAGSEVFTDEWVAYNGLDREYVHQVINHTEAYVKGNVHTNRIANFWSCLKRGLKGTYVSVEPFHLFRYLDEQAFRFNERKATDAARFVQALSNVTGRRVTYKELIGGSAPAFEPSSPAAE
jgi:transposase-like protein